MIPKCSCPEGRNNSEECTYCVCNESLYGETGYYFMAGLNSDSELDEPVELEF